MVNVHMFRFRLYPSGVQKERLFHQFDISKEMYNVLLEESKKLLVTRKFDFNSLVRDVKVCCPEYYSRVHSQVLQNVSDRLSKAFDSFFRTNKEKNKKAGYPRFKSRVRSITYPQSGFKVLLERNRLFASKIGNIPVVLHRDILGKIKTLTIKVNRAGQWFACFTCELPEVPHAKKKPCSKESVGIDVGLEYFATLSNGNHIENPRCLRKTEAKLKREQRRLSRKKKGSSNRKEAVKRVARRYIKVVNQRMDFLHKQTHQITSAYKRIGVEDLRIGNKVKNRRLAKSISDASWGKFIDLLEYKAVTCGSEVIRVDAKNTSNTCSSCGERVEMPLSKRTFECSKCNLSMQRDHNAAINICGRAGLARTYTPVETTTSASS